MNEYHKITEGQAAVFRALRDAALPPERVSRIRAEIFASAKQAAGIPDARRVKVEIDDRDSPDYRVLINKATGEKYPRTT